MRMITTEPHPAGEQNQKSAFSSNGIWFDEIKNKNKVPTQDWVKPVNQTRLVWEQRKQFVMSIRKEREEKQPNLKVEQQNYSLTYIQHSTRAACSRHVQMKTTTIHKKNRFKKESIQWVFRETPPALWVGSLCCSCLSDAVCALMKRKS